MSRLYVSEVDQINAFFEAEQQDGERPVLTPEQSAAQAAETERRRQARMAMQEQLDREGRSVFVPPGEASSDG